MSDHAFYDPETNSVKILFVDPSYRPPEQDGLNRLVVDSAPDEPIESLYVDGDAVVSK